MMNMIAYFSSVAAELDDDNKQLISEDTLKADFEEAKDELFDRLDEHDKLSEFGDDLRYVVLKALVTTEKVFYDLGFKAGVNMILEAMK